MIFATVNVNSLLIVFPNLHILIHRGKTRIKVRTYGEAIIMYDRYMLSISIYVGLCLTKTTYLVMFESWLTVFMLLSMFLYVWFASVSWFEKVDLIVECSAFVCSMYKLRTSFFV